MNLAIIQARMGSNRLPGKVLRQINGKPLLAHQIDRVSKSKLIDKIIVATSTQTQDQAIVDFCAKSNITCFRGDHHDVLGRYYSAAKQYNAKNIIRLTGDCPLVFNKTIDEVVNLFLKSHVDYAANTVPWETSTFPNGSDVEVFSFEALERAFVDCKNDLDREHVTFYFWKNPDLFKIIQLKHELNLSKIRYTVDYPNDLPVIEFLLNQIATSNIEGSEIELSNLILQNPELQSLNQNYKFTDGWV
jgi:spore coat polysaccharide biosynthesis protein SpsF